MSDPFEQARTQFLDGLAHFQAARFEAAKVCFEASLAVLPGRVSTLTNLGATHIKLGRPHEALPLLNQAITREPGNPEAWFQLGLAHVGLDQHTQALACFDKAQAVDNSGPVLWMLRAQCHSHLDQKEAALDALARALAIDPTLAQAWSERGNLLRELKRPADAAASYEKAIALGADAQTHRYFLASVRGGQGPSTAPRAYVEKLFDDYAPGFQAHLVNELHYQAHEVLVAQLPTRRFSSVLDLGCGTGLCGRLVKPFADRIDGLDISGEMIKEARKTGVYRQLIHADVAEYLGSAERCDDLVLATDVFIYIGELGPVLEGVAEILAPGGLFGFTVERARPQSGTATDVVLQPSLRYAHSENYLRRMAREHGFKVDSLTTQALREDQGRPLMGLYVVLSRP